MNFKRRLYYGICVVLVILSGLGSRKYGEYLPDMISTYAGDIFWAAMVYLGIRFLFPLLRTWKTAVFALLFSFGIEFSQLYQAEWIQGIRQHSLGALVLGQGFLWSDLVCYTIGVGLAFWGDVIVRRN